MGHDEEIPEYCKEKFRQYDEHLSEGKQFRDMTVAHSRDIKTLFNFFDDLKDIRKTIIGSAVSVIIALLVAAGGLAVTWGKTLAAVERLDKMHQGGAANGDRAERSFHREIPQADQKGA